MDIALRIGGRFETGTGAPERIFNPRNGKVIAEVPEASPAQVEEAVAAAADAFESWSRTTPAERSLMLLRLADLIERDAAAYADLEALNCGKPRHLVLADEVPAIVDCFRFFAGAVRTMHGPLAGEYLAGHTSMIRRDPVGVVASIAPWNYPLMMAAWKLAPALAAGNTIVLKPSEQTPLTALKLAKHLAGIFPEGVANIVCGRGESVGQKLISDPRVAMISLTGDVGTGRKVLAAAQATLKRTHLELGGKAPVIVFDDADLDAAVQGALASKYRNTGQTCVCTNRFLVQKGVYEDFAQRLTTAVGKLKVGDGLKGPTDQGPLIDMAAVNKVEEHVADALAKGGKLLTGGKRHALGGQFYEPTVITGATKAMLLAREETFGPVAPLFSFATESEAIALANDTEFGLASYIYTRDLARSWRVSEALEYGIVGLNTGLISTEVAPFGGIKESGFGREGSKYGILDYTEMKYVCVGGITPL